MENNNEAKVPAMSALMGGANIHIFTEYINTTLPFSEAEQWLVHNGLTTTKEPIKFDENTYYYNIVPGVYTDDNIVSTNITRIKKFMVFRDPNLKWYRICYSVHDYAPNHEISSSYGSSIIVADDHPLPVLDANGNPVRTLAKDIKVGDLLVPAGNIYAHKCNVYKIEPITNKQYIGYDIETTTDRFEVAGIVSHS